MRIEQIRAQARGKQKENRAFFARIKRKKFHKVDEAFRQAHEEVFACTDCLACATCCKTTSPLFTDKDIERISDHFGIRPSLFVEKNLRVDEDKDYVLQTLPCPFLDSKNYCTVYEVRPKACREYPHTDRKNMKQLSYLTLKNAEICPAVFSIIEQVKKKALL